MELTFKKGFKDGLPIALGYLSVAFAFGMLSIEKGLPIWSPILISVTNFTGTGQFIGIDLISLSATLTEIAFALIVINARYFLMSLSLSQRLSTNITLWQRLIIAFGNTDEIYAVSMGNNKPLNFKYMIGLILSSYLGWVGGTFVGSLSGNILPASIIAALGISLYAMFIAIIIPPAKVDSKILKIILISALLSCAFNYMPILNKVGNGWVIIICGIISSAIGALVYPVALDEKYE